MLIRIGAVLLAATVLLAAGAIPAAGKPQDQQWYLDQIGIPQAHAVTQGEGVLVGMFLASVNAGHPELAGRVRPGKYVGLDDEIKDRPSSMDTDAGRERDTGLAGLVVASGGSGVLGVAPRAEVQPINGPVGEERVSAALRWLVDEGAKVIDMSGGFTVDNDVRGIDGIRYAVSKDVVVIMDEQHALRLPEALSTGVLVVGGVDETGKRAGPPSARLDLSAPGVTAGLVDLSAPGVTAGLVGLSAEPSPDGRYGTIAAAGDQQASAIVAGVAALIRSRHPELNAASVVDRLLGTARDVGPAGPDLTFGAGIVDAADAVTTDRPAVTTNPLGDPGPPSTGSLLDRIGNPIVILAGGLCCLLVIVLVVGALILARVRRPNRARRG